jgi:predicted dehydrogenase
VSQHLKILKEARLVRDEAQGTRRIYSIDPAGLGAIRAWLDRFWDQALEAGRKLADPQAAVTKEYRELLDRRDVDAVIVGAPDHWHVPMTVDACAAGKDVYVEKPLTHSPAEGQAVIEAQNRHKRIVQVGMQQRSMPHVIKAGELIKSGRLGTIHKVHLTWNRNTPRAASPAGTESAPRRWIGRSFWAAPGTSRSTNIVSGTGDGSGISAGASSPT